MHYHFHTTISGMLESINTGLRSVDTATSIFNVQMQKNVMHKSGMWLMSFKQFSLNYVGKLVY